MIEGDEESGGIVVSLTDRLSFKPTANGSTEVIKPERPCSHWERVIHVNERAVRCKRCSARLDPFDVLLDDAGDYERRTADYRDLGEQIQKRRRDLVTLQRLENNCRSRLKRLLKDGEPEKRSGAFPEPPLIAVALDGNEVVVASGEQVDRLKPYWAIDLARQLQTKAHAALEAMRLGSAK